MMTDMEHDVHFLIKEWYRSIDDEYFDYKPWHHLYDEERRMVAEMYWETKLEDESC